jgi:AraC-like DNA-binding protein
MQYLACLDKLFHSACDIFNRDIGIDPMLIQEIDVVCPETLETSIHHPFDVFGPAVQALNVDDLASISGMSRSTLHHHFRSLTAMSPLQFQKPLRLHAARQKMLTEELDAASAAFEVGYESPSQFNREYKRFFGQPPIRDIQALRASV